jgi:hypothetical protein
LLRQFAFGPHSKARSWRQHSPGASGFRIDSLAETFALEIARIRYVCTIGRFPDDRIAEIFMGNHKADSHADTNARDAAIACSLALQHGASIEVIRRALSRDSRGLPYGPLGVALDRLAADGDAR